MNVVEVVLETKGNVVFASREVGRTVDTAEYLLNTALYYALGFASGRYHDSTLRPTYVEDTEDVADVVYVTPAAPVEQPDYWTTIYNARGDRYATVNYTATEDPEQHLNLPRFGRQRSFTQGNQFRCYLIPREGAAAELVERLPTYVRLGKKRGKAKLSARTVSARRESGQFTANHPFSVYDYDGTPLGSVISKNMRPTPLILQAEYEDDHLAIPRGSGSPPVKLPANLRFLETKR